MSNRRPHILMTGLAFGEGPRWRDGKLWFSDMHACRVMTVDLRGRHETILEVPGQPSGLGWLPEGGLLVVSMTDRRLLRVEGGMLTDAADLSQLASFHCNDMVIDRRGNAYVGHFGFDFHRKAAFEPAEIILVRPDGQAQVVARDMAFPNGSVITQDGRTLIVAESFAARLTAFDILPDGALAHRRVWAALETSPDGICLDAEGAIWVACPQRPEVLRVQEGGKVLDRIATSDKSFACMLGGDEGRHLFIMTARGSNPERSLISRSGRVEVIEVDVPHAGLP